MALPKFSTLYDEWEVGEDDSLTAPLIKNEPEQVLIFSGQIKNGTIRAAITPIQGAENRRGESGREGAVIFRYAGQEGYYYAGLGAFGAKFFIAKVLPGPVWQLLGSAGRYASIQFDQTYNIRIDCSGNQLTFFENDVRQIVVYDDNYQVGQWGLRTWRTSTRFSEITLDASTPVCFVVMPFAIELDFVYRVIKETAESYGMRCIRADEVMVSRPVVEDLKTMIAEADLVIVDFTGKNPNVYYEAGVADAWKKKWIVLAQRADDLTFDVQHIRTILYSNTMGADVKLRENLQQAIQETMGLMPAQRRDA